MAIEKMYIGEENSVNGGNGWFEVEATLNKGEKYTCTFDFNVFNHAIRFKSERGTFPSLYSCLEMLRELSMNVWVSWDYRKKFQEISKVDYYNADGMNSIGILRYIPGYGFGFKLSQLDELPLRLPPPGGSAKFLETQDAMYMLDYFIAAEVAPVLCYVKDEDEVDTGPLNFYRLGADPNFLMVPADTGWTIKIKPS